MGIYHMRVHTCCVHVYNYMCMHASMLVCMHTGITYVQLNLILHLLVCSLLDVLADRKKRDHVSGYVLINGEKQPQNFKCAAGYVVQVSYEDTKLAAYSVLLCCAAGACTCFTVSSILMLL